MKNRYHELPSETQGEIDALVNTLASHPGRHGRVGPSSDREAADAMLDLLQEHLDLTALVLLLQARLDHASQRDIQVALDKARELARDFAVASDQRQTWTHMAVLLRQQLARF